MAAEDAVDAVDAGVPDGDLDAAVVNWHQQPLLQRLKKPPLPQQASTYTTTQPIDKASTSRITDPSAMVEATLQDCKEAEPLCEH